MAETPGKRRLDRVLDPGFLEGLRDLDIADLRQRRNDARSEEEELSFKRRMLQGRLEVLSAYANRAGDDAESLVRDITSALNTDTIAPAGNARAVSLDPPLVDSEEARGRRYLERLLRDVDWSGLSEAGSEKLAEVTTVLKEQEQWVSATRARLHVVLDQLTAELGRRYREDGAKPPVG